MSFFHVAIVQRPVAAALVAGRKRIETRFYRQRRPPLGRIRPGDTVHFKLAGGGLIGRAQADDVKEFTRLTPTRVDRLRRTLGNDVCAPARYWSAHRRCRYGILIWLGPLADPVDGLVVPRQYGGGWVVLGRG